MRFQVVATEICVLDQFCGKQEGMQVGLEIMLQALLFHIFKKVYKGTSLNVPFVYFSDYLESFK